MDADPQSDALGDADGMTNADAAGGE